MRFSFLNTQVTACYNVIIRTVCTGIIGVTFTLYTIRISPHCRDTLISVWRGTLTGICRVKNKKKK